MSSSSSSSTSSSTSLPSVLLLGMVFAHQAQEPKRGQEFRDRVRCEALRDSGYQVYTIDNKHDDSKIPEHCTGNFVESRRLLKSMKLKWPNVKSFDYIILDYFFSPAGWARERWNSTFFTNTLPNLLKEGYINEDTIIILPFLDCIEERIRDNFSLLSSYFFIEREEDCLQNPLYKSTENVKDELLRCPDNLTNETQILPLKNYSSTPFITLRVKKDEKIQQDARQLFDTETIWKFKKIIKNENNINNDIKNMKKRKLIDNDEMKKKK